MTTVVDGRAPGRRRARPYATAKGGVIRLTRCAALAASTARRARQLRRAGDDQTPLWDDFRPHAIGEENAAHARAEGARRGGDPARPVGTPEEAGALVAFLLSDDASYVSRTCPSAGGAEDDVVRQALRASALS